jgi:phage shock protein C
MAQEKPKRLYRSANERVLGGICGGIAEYFNVDPVLVRLLWVFASLLYGAGILLYIIAWIAIPRNPRHRWD